MKLRYYLNIYLINGMQIKVPFDLTKEEVEITKNGLAKLVFESDYNYGGAKIQLQTGDTFIGVIAVVWEN